MSAAALPAALGKLVLPAAVGLGGSLFSKKLSKPPGLSPAGQAAQTGLTEISTELRGTGRNLIGAGQDLVQGGRGALERSERTLNPVEAYYSKLVGGDRAATAAAVAPEVQSLTSIYSGARRGLDRSSLTGANRDVAEAELSRQQAGDIGNLVLKARPGAVAGLAGVADARRATGQSLVSAGVGTTGAGVGALGGAAGPLSTLYGAEQRRSEQQGQNQASIGSFFASLVYDMLRNQGKGGGGGSPLSAYFQNFQGVPFRPAVG